MGDRQNVTKLWRCGAVVVIGIAAAAITFSIHHVKKLILFAFRHITLNMHVDPMYPEAGRQAGSPHNGVAEKGRHFVMNARKLNDRRLT